MQKLGRLVYTQPGNEEGQVKLSLDFFRLPIVMQMDIMSDWISDLENLMEQICMAAHHKPQTKGNKNASHN